MPSLFVTQHIRDLRFHFTTVHPMSDEEDDDSYEDYDKCLYEAFDRIRRNDPFLRSFCAGVHSSACAHLLAKALDRNTHLRTLCP
jgi:hypothetical protein